MKLDYILDPREHKHQLLLFLIANQERFNTSSYAFTSKKQPEGYENFYFYSNFNYYLGEILNLPNVSNFDTIKVLILLIDRLAYSTRTLKDNYDDRCYQYDCYSREHRLFFTIFNDLISKEKFMTYTSEVADSDFTYWALVNLYLYSLRTLVKRMNSDGKLEPEYINESYYTELIAHYEVTINSFFNLFETKKAVCSEMYETISDLFYTIETNIDIKLEENTILRIVDFLTTYENEYEA